MPNQPIPQELKEQALIKLLPPYSWSLRQVSKEIGVAHGTVFKWRKQLENEGVLMPNNKEPEDYSAEQIFTFILDTATFSEHQLAEYCREKGLFVDQLKQWKRTSIDANRSEATKAIHAAKESRLDKKRIKILEKDLKRKEKALAETAALLVLREKYNALWETSEDE